MNFPDCYVTHPVLTPAEVAVHPLPLHSQLPYEISKSRSQTITWTTSLSLFPCQCPISPKFIGITVQSPINFCSTAEVNKPSFSKCLKMIISVSVSPMGNVIGKERQFPQTILNEWLARLSKKGDRKTKWKGNSVRKGQDNGVCLGT